MSSEDLKIFLEDLVDWLSSHEAGIVKLKRQIEKLIGPSKAEAKGKWSWNPEKVKWSQAEGTKGVYERSEDVNSLDFKNLLKDLANHKGFLVRDSYSYWVFKNGSTVGRKKRVKE